MSEGRRGPGSRRILIVDDEEAVRAVLARFLSGRGHDVLSAGDALEGLALARKGGVDLVLLDNNLPGMMGLAALPRFDAAGIPVILITGYPSEETFKDALLLGAKAFLVKPLDLEKLAAEIESALGH